MEYIRTKNGEIFDYESTHDIDVDGFIVQHINGWNEPLMKEDIIKIADTIEELCDEFVFVYKRKHYKCEIHEDYWGRKSIVFKKRIYHKTGIGISSLETITKKFSTAVRDGSVYGAIWTDKGLIYVAKMNEKGELELYD